MLVVRPAEASPTTAPTPTPIGCKLLKINLLTNFAYIAPSFREVRILQNFKFASTAFFET
jgi:hypothetical protein